MPDPFFFIKREVNPGLSPNSSHIAEAWLRGLLKTLDLSADDIIPASGNHDINLKKAAATAVPSDHIKADELLDLDSLESVSVPFKGFEDFCKYGTGNLGQ